MNVDITRLAEALSERLHQRFRELAPLGIPCTWPVFRAVTADGRAMFVKVTEKAAAERTLTCLGSAGDCPLLPRPFIELDVLRRDKPLRLLPETANDRIYARFK